MRLGVDHIRTGPDHILFVLVLLLPALLVFNMIWRPAKNFGASLWRITRIVSMFTVAHTITFSLAGFDILPLPPSKFVEAIIAISITAAAIHNLRPIAQNKEWLIAFAFGLFHGLGFAGLVDGLEVSQSTKLLSLLGRNLGIEIDLKISQAIEPMVQWPRSLVVMAILTVVAAAIREVEARKGRLISLEHPVEPSAEQEAVPVPV